MLIDTKFSSETEQFVSSLKQFKQACDEFDTKHTDQSERNNFILDCFQKEKEIFDNHFSNIWDYIVKEKLMENIESYKGYKNYYYSRLSKYLLNPAINFQINKKPLGYPGDFIVMNYMYDYNPETGKFLGESSFEKYVNRYTCSVPIARSNIERKEHLKNKILNVSKNGAKKITSIACGSIREMFEASEKLERNDNIQFMCFDFEQKVFEYINAKVKQDGIRGIDLQPIHADIMCLIKDKEMGGRLSGSDFVYCSGLFDYLSERLAEKLFGILNSYVNKGGELIVCNASEEYSSHRAYYEFLGDWNLIYRKKEQVQKWARKISDTSNVNIYQTHENGGYWFISIKK